MVTDQKASTDGCRLAPTVEVDDTVLRVLDEHDNIITVLARTTRKEATRYKAYGHTHAQA